MCERESGIRVYYRLVFRAVFKKMATHLTMIRLASVLSGAAKMVGTEDEY